MTKPIVTIKQRKPVDIVFNGRVLKTAGADINGIGILTLPRNEYYEKFMPDSDKVLLEDFNGYRYKRIELHNQKKYIFEKI